MHSAVDDFQTKAKALALPGTIVGASSAEISLLESVAGCGLPPIWRDLVGSCLGANSSFLSGVIYGPSMVEPFSYPMSAGAELSLIDEIIAKQREFSEDDNVNRILRDASFFYAGKVTGDGAAVVLVGSEDPTVVLIDDSFKAKTWSLVSLRLSSWLAGMLPQDGVGPRLAPDHPQPVSTFALPNDASPPIDEVLAVVDEILDSVMTTRLPRRGSQISPIGREWIVGADHDWIRSRSDAYGLSLIHI